MMASPLQLLKKWWMVFAHAVGWFNTRVLLTIAYVLIIGIGAIILKLIRKDLLHREFTQEKSYWKDKEPVKHSLEEAQRQF